MQSLCYVVACFLLLIIDITHGSEVFSPTYEPTTRRNRFKNKNLDLKIKSYTQAPSTPTALTSISISNSKISETSSDVGNCKSI